MDLMRRFAPNEPAWLTGSTVWLPAVFGDPPVPNGDFDLVFSDALACKLFIQGTVDQLNSVLPPGQAEYAITNTRFNGARILHPDGSGVMDVWHLADNESIGELLLAYPGDTHIKCAYYLSENPSSGCLFRLVDPVRLAGAVFALTTPPITPPISSSGLGGLLGKLNAQPIVRSSYPGC